MSSRSLNKVQLIGNVTRDPELRYTPQGTAVCSFGLATNRSWLPEGATERREEVEFHRLVAWNKLAELCSQLITKGRKIYIEGRLQTRSWETPDGEKRQATEIVVEDMMLLDSRPPKEGAAAVAAATPSPAPAAATPAKEAEAPVSSATSSKKEKKSGERAEDNVSEKEEPKSKDPAKEKSEDGADIDLDDIPF